MHFVGIKAFLLPLILFELIFFGKDSVNTLNFSDLGNVL